jgi:hypothetical protein
MVDNKPKVKLTFVGLLSPFRLLYVPPEGIGIDIQIARHMVGITEAVESLGDFNKGVKIGPNVVLRLTSKEDAENAKPFLDIVSNQFSIRLNEYVLESSVEIEDDPLLFSALWGEINDNINSVINALRLLKEGYIEANNRLVITVRGSEKKSSLIKETAIPHYEFQTAYNLMTKELHQVEELTEQVASFDLSKRKRLRIALDRFERSYYEPYLEDQLIDYMIAFEALFIGKKMREQSSVIPVAAAMLLGNTEEDREEIIKIMDLAYEIRNCIVHGSDYEERLKNNKTEMQMLTREVEEILRNSLQKLI